MTIPQSILNELQTTLNKTEKHNTIQKKYDVLINLDKLRPIKKEKDTFLKVKGQMDDFKNEKKNKGDRCVKDGRPAVCTPISKCQSALTDIVKMKLPQVGVVYSLRKFREMQRRTLMSQLTLGNEAKFFIEVLGWTLGDKRGDPRSESYLFGSLLLTNPVTYDGRL
ncbi:hypothetical protein EVAR_97809_1 [Eumeta japonica]|uniref:Uncharacterized protein n=1 Tax=Eumeta variegata TaxID=151549 RepID=A0A4C1XDQ5_EUMVA|nr:hypothetical protein EVAR_97809_1 [Eumeta japonica]